MKQIVEFFGGSIVAVVVAGFVLGFMAHMPQQMGLATSESWETTGQDIRRNEAFGEFCENVRWQLSVKEKYYIQSGVGYDVSDFMTATDPEGHEAQLYMISAMHQENPSTYVSIENDGRRFRFTKPGVYRILMGMRSAGGAYYDREIRLLVN